MRFAPTAWNREELGEASAEEVQYAARRQDGVLRAGEAVDLRQLAGDERKEPEQGHGEQDGDDDAVVGGRAEHAAPHDGSVEAERRGCAQREERPTHQETLEQPERGPPRPAQSALTRRLPVLSC